MDRQSTQNNPTSYPNNNAYISQSYLTKNSNKFNTNNYQHYNNQQRKNMFNNYASSQSYLNHSQVINNSSNMTNNNLYLQGQKSHSSTLILSNNTDSQVTDNNKSGGYVENSGEISTKILHEKIHYLQRQLQQLTILLQQQSRISQSGGSNYEELAIQNAQLTIKAQELQQIIEKYKQKLNKTTQELKQTLQQLQTEHQANNKLRDGLLSFQQKISQMENELSDYRNQQNHQNSNSSIQNQIIRLNQQISDLLQRLHVLTSEYTEQQIAKEEVMQKLNDQNLVVESLRREVSEAQIKILQLKEQNNYLKDQITKIDQMSLAKQRQIQDKYIKQQVEAKYYYEKVQSENRSLLLQIKSYQKQIQQYQQEVDTLKIKNSRISRSNVELNEQRLMGEIKNLQDELITQKQKQNIIKEKFTRIIDDLEDKIKQFQIENRKLKLQIRKMENQVNQYKNTINQLSIKKTEEESANIQIQRFRYEIEQLSQNKKQSTSIISNHEKTIRQLQQRLNQIQNNLQQKMQQLDQKQYLTTQLHQLQQKHQELLDQVKKLKGKNSRIQSQTSLVERQRQTEREREEVHLKEINQLRLKITQLQEKVYSLRQHSHKLQSKLKGQEQKKKVHFQNDIHNQFYKQSESQKLLKQQVLRLTHQVNKFIQWRQNIQRLQEAKLIENYKKQTKCQNCQNVLRQFLIYKELQQIKMEYIVDNIKYNKKQSENQELLKQKIHYEGWLKEYTKNQENYRILQERVWEWEKLKTKNQSVNHILKEDKNRDNKSKSQQQSQRKNIQYVHEIEYELNLIKIQNSSLRGQIQSLEHQIKQLLSNTSHESYKIKSSSQVEIKLLQEDKRFLQQQNQNLKNHIKQLNKEENHKINSLQKTMGQKQKQINNLKRQLRDTQTTIQSLQNQYQYQHQLTLRSRLSTQQLQSGLLINNHNNNNHLSNNRISEPQIIDRHNLPYQYVKYHPEHKKLQSQFVQLKRAYLQLQLHYKKQKQMFQDEMKRLQIQKNYHKSRIIELQNQLHSIHEEKRSLISFNSSNMELTSSPKNDQNQRQQLQQIRKRYAQVQNQLKIKSQSLLNIQRKYEELYEKYEHEKKLSHKIQNYQSSTNKKERTNSDSSNINIGKIQVSPIKSPSWEYYEHDDIQVQNQYAKLKSKNREIVQVQEECELLKRRINKYNQDVQKLKEIIDQKIIELNITPRQPTNAISRAIWFIQRLSTDMKQLKIDLEILKGQKKALIKQKNLMKEELENNSQQSSRYRGMKGYSKNHNNKESQKKIYKQQNIQQYQRQEHNNLYSDSTNILNSKQNNFKGGIPKLNLAQNNTGMLFSFNKNIQNIQENEYFNKNQQNVDVLNQAELLKQERRNKINMFKNELMKNNNSYSYNLQDEINNVKVH